MDKKQPKDPRKERLAKQLRANLQRRKEQAREREADASQAGYEPTSQGDRSSPRGNT